MLAFFLILFLLWLFFKLGIGLVKAFAFILVIGIVGIFFTYLLLPLLVLFIIGSLFFAVIS